VSVESPLPPLVQRSLGDRSFDKRKNAALEIEQLVKSLNEAHNIPMISSIIAVLAKDFCTSMNANYRKGGLIGIAATAIGLMGNARSHLDGLLFPVLQCFDDPESRVRYYACESLYNISKVARGSILRYFNQIFDGLTKLFADVDVDVKNGANLLDRLIKDIVTESETFHVEHFLPLLTTYIRRTNPYIRQLLVGWITVLDSVPDISMIDYLPDFLDGLFNMLSDSNREIRQAADSALSDFLKEVKHATVIEFGPIVSILVNQSLSKDRLNRLTAITWIEELIHHPYSGGDAFLPHHAEVLSAILYCISDAEEQICLVAERTNADLLSLVKDTQGDFRLAPLLKTLTEKIMTKDDVPTKMASLRWINMLLEKRRGDMTEFVSQLLPILLKTLSDASDAVVLFTLQVLARISLGDGGGPLDEDYTPPVVQNNGEADEGKPDDVRGGGLLWGEKDEKHFKLVINAILGLFASDRMLLENRGSLVVRKFCVLLDAESVYMLMAEVLSHSCEIGRGGVAPKEESFGADGVENGSSVDVDGDNKPVKFSIEFVSTMVQTLNLILLTANELHGLRVLLANALERNGLDRDVTETEPADEHIGTRKSVQVFETLFRCWCHSPVSIFSLCLLARAYGVAFALVQKFSELEVTVGKEVA
jgi:vacuole morphology and inheritance protein 14